MTYIEPHNDPKILKLGIRMALYDEPMPAKNISVKGVNFTLLSRMDYWRKNHRISYLKEPEFVEGEVVYYKNDIGGKSPMIINRKEEERVWLINKFQTKDSFEGCFDWDEMSHYYPRQEVESFKYVREKKVLFFRQGIYKSEWQEVEEPVKVKGNIGMKKPNPEHTKFQAEIKQAKILAEIK